MGQVAVRICFHFEAIERISSSLLLLVCVWVLGVGGGKVRGGEQR